MEREQDKVGHNGVGCGKPWGTFSTAFSLHGKIIFRWFCFHLEKAQ